MVYYIILRGPLGVGKSAIAKKLANLLSSKIYSIDSLLEKFKLDKTEQDYISLENFIKVQESILPEAKEKLQNGKCVILEGNFYYKEQIDHLIGNLPFAYFVFTLTAPLATCIERDSKRKTPYGKDACEAVYAAVSRVKCGQDIDTSKDLRVVVEDILTKII